MYLISLYFDKKTNQIIQNHIEGAAEHSGNGYMLEKEVPPHITLTAFETKLAEESLIALLDEVISLQKVGNVQWVSVGAFFPQVLFLIPVLNEYLHGMSECVCNRLATDSTAKIQNCYRPFCWMPHTTIAKKLSKEEMRLAFARLQNEFAPFSGTVERIGLSRATPKKEIKSWELRKKV